MPRHITLSCSIDIAYNKDILKYGTFKSLFSKVCRVLLPDLIITKKPRIFPELFKIPTYVQFRLRRFYNNSAQQDTV